MDQRWFWLREYWNFGLWLAESSKPIKDNSFHTLPVALQNTGKLTELAIKQSSCAL